MNIVLYKCFTYLLTYLLNTDSGCNVVPRADGNQLPLPSLYNTAG